MEHMTGSHFCRWHAGVRLQASQIPRRTREGLPSFCPRAFPERRQRSRSLSLKHNESLQPPWPLKRKVGKIHSDLGSPVCLPSFRKCQSCRRIWFWEIGKTFIGKTGILMFACKPFSSPVRHFHQQQELWAGRFSFFSFSFFFASLTLN